MNDPVFSHDVFLSHNAKDKAVVHAVAWQCSKSVMHTSDFDVRISNFGLPLSLRLDDAPIKGSLAQFLCINWRSADRTTFNPADCWNELTRIAAIP